MKQPPAKDKKTAVLKLLNVLAGHYSKDIETIEKLYLKTHSIDYVIYKLDREIKKGEPI